MTTATHADDNRTSKVLAEQLQREQHLDESFTPIFRINSEKSLARNRKLLKDLEHAKARLRTYAAYTPTDQELRQRAAEYRKHLRTCNRKSDSSQT